MWPVGSWVSRDRPATTSSPPAGLSRIRHLLLADLISDIYARSRGTYGMLRIRAALEIEQGIVVNKKPVWKITSQLGLRGLPGPKKRSANRANQATEEDLVERNFCTSAPNELGSPTSPGTPLVRARSPAAWSSTSSSAR